jgi:anti-anti-sigma regulatory factor
VAPRRCERLVEPLRAAAQEPICRLAVEDGSLGPTLVISGELCFSSAPRIEKELAAHEGSAAFSVIDLRELRFIDLSGLDVVRRAWSRATSAGHLPTVVQAPCLERLLDVLEINDQFFTAGP